MTPSLTYSPFACSFETWPGYGNAVWLKDKQLLPFGNIAQCAMPTATKDCSDMEALTARISADLDVALGTKPADLGVLIDGLGVSEACREWLTGVSASGTESRAQINSAHTSLIHFISCRMKELCDELNVSDAAGNPKRFLLVCASGQTQIEVGKDLSLNDLMCAVVDPSANQPEHANPASAVLFVKAEQFGKQDLAYCQLIHDTRLLFVNQPNRRFMWGVTLSGTLARVVLFLDEHMLSSSDIDMITPAGRAAYIQFIVSLCHCERHQLGYDPSMTWCPENEYWIINCPGLAAAEDGERRVTRYYTRGSASGADRLFGRHTRGFMASADPARVDVPDTFIENAWPHMDRITQDMPCDELAAMLRIKQSVHAIGNSSCFDGFTLHVHRQVTLQTIGRPLSALSSPYELIIVLADAMVAHLDVLNQRNSPHRNISINNILAIEVGGRVRGMLTDFDCAAKVGGHHQACDEQTGLPPFMSINNLRNSSVERSELDDWESLLYVVCWLGVHGVSEAEQHAFQHEVKMLRDAYLDYRPPLFEWGNGSFKEAADLKAWSLTDTTQFTSNVLSHFRPGPGYDMLKKLALGLRRWLLFNPRLSNTYRGICSVEIYSDVYEPGTEADINMDIVLTEDPFVKRLEKDARDKINEDLFKTMVYFKSAAINAFYDTN